MYLSRLEALRTTSLSFILAGRFLYSFSGIQIDCLWFFFERIKELQMEIGAYNGF